MKHLKKKTEKEKKDFIIYYSKTDQRFPESTFQVSIKVI